MRGTKIVGQDLTRQQDLEPIILTSTFWFSRPKEEDVD